jgi:hypothetical protein
MLVIGQNSFGIVRFIGTSVNGFVAIVLVRNGNTWNTEWLMSQIVYVKAQLPWPKFGFEVMLLFHMK